MAAKRIVKVGMVGAGFMGQFAHLANLAEIEQCEVVALAEPRPILREKVARAYGIPRTYESHRELLDDGEVEAVVAVTSDLLNHPIGCDVMAAGRHLLTEKPMAASVKQAEELAELAAEKNVKYMVGFMKRHDDGVLLARREIEEWARSGERGRMTFARAHCFGGDWRHNFGRAITTDEPKPTAPAPSDGPAWMTDHEKRRFRSFTNIMSHNINLLRFLAGREFQVESAAAHGDDMLVALRSGDMLASLERGSCACHWWDEQTVLYFERGWVDVRTPTPLHLNTPAQVEIYEAGLTHHLRSPLAPWTWAFKQQAQHFIDCIRNDTEPRASGADAVKGMRLAEEIFRKLRG